jgi:hypothetical protein
MWVGVGRGLRLFQRGGGRKPLKEFASGGFRVKAPGSKASSYLTELAGVLDLLRTLMQTVDDQHPPGAVEHWCDNMSVCNTILHRSTTTARKWRSKPCRDMWAELIRRLHWWTKEGGAWDTRWVKGHVDADASRKPAEYTAAERLNIRADRVAERVSKSVEVPEKWATIVNDPRVQFGGIWWRVEADGTSGMFWDNIGVEIQRQGRAKAGARYWSKRQRGRGVTTKTTATPAWDDRVLPRLGGKRKARTAVDIFRTQLWWDHLPSPVNFLRGKATPEDAKCLYCDAPGIVTSWHILAKCPNVALVSARRAATVGIHTAIADGFGRNAVEIRNMMTKVMRLNGAGGVAVT